MRDSLPKLARRAAELRRFDLTSLSGDDRDDNRMDQLLNKYNAMLLDIFGPNTIEYNRYSMDSLWSSSEPLTLGFDYASNVADAERARRAYGNGIDKAISNIETIRTLFDEKLQDAAEHGTNAAVAEVQVAGRPPTRTSGKRVFIVHGRDEAAKAAVARFIAQLGLDPVILHEQPNASRTIIEKLEQHLDVDFAVVLLTPDDVGAISTDPINTRPRARQNVVLELGLFLGALGRTCVCALHKGDLELPSDFDGVVYVPLDDADGWKMKLAREMKQAGLDVDLNRAM